MVSLVLTSDLRPLSVWPIGVLDDFEYGQRRSRPALTEYTSLELS